MDHFSISNQQTQVARDFDSFDLHCASLEKPPDMEDFVGTAVDTLLTEVERWFRDAELDLKNIVNSHPFYVMFEPSLGCDARTDHTTPKSVYPVFMADFSDTMASLQCKITSIIEPTIRKLIGSREALIFENITTQLAGNSDRDAEFLALQRELEAMKVVSKDITMQKDEIRDSLTKEINMLREQLFQKKVRIGGLYKPDFAPGFGMDATAVMLPGTGGGFTQADIDHAVKDANDRFNEEKKRIDSRYRAELQSAETQTARLATEVDSLKSRLEEAEKEADALRTRCEDDVDKQKAYYDDQIEYLNSQVASLTEATRSATTIFENELAARDRDINKLSAELRDSLEREDYLKGIMNQLKREHKDEVDQIQKQHTKDMNAQKAELMAKVAEAEKAASDILAKNNDAQIADLLAKLKQQEERNAVLETQCQSARSEMEEAIKAMQEQHERELENIHSEYNSNSMISDLSGAVEDAEKEFKSVIRCVELIFNRLFDDRTGAMTKMLITKDFNPADYSDSKKHPKMDASHFSEVSEDSMLRTEPTIRVGVSGVEDLSESVHDVDKSVSDKSGKTAIPNNYLYKTVEKMINQQRMGKLANKHLNKALKQLLTWSKTYANSKLVANFRGDYGLSQLSISTDNSMYKDDSAAKKKRLDISGMFESQTRIINGPRDDLTDLRALRPLVAEIDLITSRIDEQGGDSKASSTAGGQKQAPKDPKKGTKRTKDAPGRDIEYRDLVASTGEPTIAVAMRHKNEEELLYGNYANMSDRDFADQFFTNEQGIPQMTVINSIILPDMQLVGERTSNSYLNAQDSPGQEDGAPRDQDTVDISHSEHAKNRRTVLSDNFQRGENVAILVGRSSDSAPGLGRFIDVGVNTVICTTAGDNVYFTKDKTPIVMQASHAYECGDCLAIRNELSDPHTSHGSGRRTPASSMHGSGTARGSEQNWMHGGRSVEWRGIRGSDAQSEADRKSSVVAIPSTKEGADQTRETSALTRGSTAPTDDSRQRDPTISDKGSVHSGHSMPNALAGPSHSHSHDHVQGGANAAMGADYGSEHDPDSAFKGGHVYSHGHFQIGEDGERYFICPRCGFQIPFADIAKEMMVSTGPPAFLFNNAPAAVPSKRNIEPIAPGSYLSEKALAQTAARLDSRSNAQRGVTGAAKDVIGFARPPPVDDFESMPATKYQPFPQRQFKVPTYPAFKPGARGGTHTNPNMEGVFTRILQRAEELRIRYLRKRELILQERKRTTERILRALSLLTEAPPAAPYTNVTESMGIFAATPAIIRPQTTNNAIGSVNSSERVHRMTNSANAMFGSDRGNKDLNGHLFGNIFAQDDPNASTDVSRGTSGRGSGSKLSSAKGASSGKTPFDYKQSTWTQRHSSIDYVAKGKQTIAESNQLNDEILSRLNIPGRRSSTSQRTLLSTGSRRPSSQDPNAMAPAVAKKAAQQGGADFLDQKKIQSAQAYGTAMPGDSAFRDYDDNANRRESIGGSDTANTYRGYAAKSADRRRGATLSALDNYRPRSAYSAFPANALGDRSAHGTRKFNRQSGETIQRNPSTKMSDVLDVLSTAGLVRKQ